jgi:hypothetical protein
VIGRSTRSSEVEVESRGGWHRNGVVFPEGWSDEGLWQHEFLQDAGPRSVVLASREVSFFIIIIILAAEPSSMETLTWQIQICFPHIFRVSFFTCAMLHVSCYPIIFFPTAVFFGGDGVAGESQCEVLFFPV